jgi:hypothetical protein
MNDDVNLTDEQVKLATTRSLPADAALDAETVAVHESFMALGSALESSGGQFDEAALIARLEESWLREQKRVRRPSQRDWWTIVVSGALAAAVLVVIGWIGWGLRHRDALVAVPPSANHSLPLTDAWNDPLDDEIAFAAATIGQLTGRNRGFDDSLLEMNERLEAMSQELLGESL